MMEHAVDFGAIILADLVLSGDNALIIGMAAAGLAPELRAVFVLVFPDLTLKQLKVRRDLLNAGSVGCPIVDHQLRPYRVREEHRPHIAEADNRQNEHYPHSGQCDVPKADQESDDSPEFPVEPGVKFVRGFPRAVASRASFRRLRFGQHVEALQGRDKHRHGPAEEKR